MQNSNDAFIANLCIVCAYRAYCKKRFTLSTSLYYKCPEFERDLLLDRKPKPNSKKEKENNSSE